MKKEVFMNFLTNPEERRSTLDQVYRWVGGKYACVDLTWDKQLSKSFYIK